MAKDWLKKFLEPLTVVTFLLFGATIALYSATRDLVHDAERNARQQMRAYIGFIPEGVENFGDKEKQVFKMTRKNYGLTPAYNVVASPTLHDVVKIGAPLPVTFSPSPGSVPKDTPTVFPSMENQLRIMGHAQSQTQIDLAKDGREYQFIYYGIVYYDDAFGKPHYTRYCWIFKGPSMTAKEADACLGHNDSN